MSVFARYLRYRREQQRLSQVQLAEAMNTEQAEISKWERGIRKRPSADQIQRFAQVLGDDVANFALAAAGIDPRGRPPGASGPPASGVDTRTLWDFIPLPDDVDEQERRYLALALPRLIPALLDAARDFGDSVSVEDAAADADARVVVPRTRARTSS